MAKSLKNLTNFLGFSTGSSSISAGSGPKSADFSKFSRLHALCGKKFWKFDLDLLKMPNFLRPHQIFQEIQGFIAFLCGNIFSNFSRLHLIILAKSWWNFTWIRQNRNKTFFSDKKTWNSQGFCAPPIKFSKKIKVLLGFHVVIFLKFLQ